MFVSWIVYILSVALFTVPTVACFSDRLWTVGWVLVAFNLAVAISLGYVLRVDLFVKNLNKS